MDREIFGRIQGLRKVIEFLIEHREEIAKLLELIAILAPLMEKNELGEGIAEGPASD